MTSPNLLLVLKCFFLWNLHTKTAAASDTINANPPTLNPTARPITDEDFREIDTLSKLFRTVGRSKATLEGVKLWDTWESVDSVPMKMNRQWLTLLGLIEGGTSHTAEFPLTMQVVGNEQLSQFKISKRIRSPTLSLKFPLHYCSQQYHCSCHTHFLCHLHTESWILERSKFYFVLERSFNLSVINLISVYRRVIRHCCNLVISCGFQIFLRKFDLLWLSKRKYLFRCSMPNNTDKNPPFSWKYQRFSILKLFSLQQISLTPGHRSHRIPLSQWFQ